MDIHFVYTLSYKEKVFYVGCSNRPIARFWSHMTWQNKTTARDIYSIIKHGGTPVLNIIFHSKDRRNSLVVEMETIFKYGDSLCNCAHNKKHIDHSYFDFDYVFTDKYDSVALKSFNEYFHKNVKQLKHNEYVDYNSKIRVKGRNVIKKKYAKDATIKVLKIENEYENID